MTHNAELVERNSFQGVQREKRVESGREER